MRPYRNIASFVSEMSSYLPVQFDCYGIERFIARFETAFMLRGTFAVIR